MTNDELTLKQINKSGYPFQLRVEEEIRQTQRVHGWSVASSEHPWTSTDKEASGFIDLVLKHDQFNTFRLVLECKRMKAEDARQLQWIFLTREQESEPTSLMSCFEVAGRMIGTESEGFAWADMRVWDNVRLTPLSLQSEFCILQSDDGRRQPILESLAAEVLESIEGLAEEELKIQRQVSSRTLSFIFPAIVTNAELAVCRLDPAKINIADGTLDKGNVEITTVPFIRFRKSLATHLPEGKFYDLKQANKARERTVFVVNASSLPEFLKEWKMNPWDAFDRYAIEKFIR